jgi:cytochrome c oxidase subunit IV
MSDQHEHKGYYTGDIHNQYIEEHYDPKNRGVIWRTFWILLVITIFEVAIAFTSLSKELLMYIFIVLTIVKAYFIVAFFMHLKHERLSFGYTIILPFLLIVYLIAMCIAEGSYIHLWGGK